MAASPNYVRPVVKVAGESIKYFINYNFTSKNNCTATLHQRLRTNFYI